MQNMTKISKFLSLILRHSPEKIGLTLNDQGWVNVEKLLKKANLARNSHGKNRLTMETLEYIVDNNDKKRFEFNDDKTEIRASQGHSVKVDLGYEAKEPPKTLYHGTGLQSRDAIAASGLKKMNRHAVHLSTDMVTASNVGKRHGRLVLYIVAAKDMYDDGHKFHLSNNGVWLTDNVPVDYLTAYNNNYKIDKRKKISTKTNEITCDSCGTDVISGTIQNGLASCTECT